MNKNELQSLLKSINEVHVQSLSEMEAGPQGIHEGILNRLKMRVQKGAADLRGGLNRGLDDLGLSDRSRVHMHNLSNPENPINQKRGIDTDHQQSLVFHNNTNIINHGMKITGLDMAEYLRSLHDPSHQNHAHVVAAHAESQKSHPTEGEIRKKNPTDPFKVSDELERKITDDKTKQRSDIDLRVQTPKGAVDRFLQNNPRALGIYKAAATAI